MSLSECRMIDLPKVSNQQGNLTFIEGAITSLSTLSAFTICTTYQVELHVGACAQKLHQLIIAISGSFDITLDDGRGQKTFHLNRSYNGLYICPMIWRELNNFSTGSVCMVLASSVYREDDYHRDYAEFLESCRSGK